MVLEQQNDGDNFDHKHVDDIKILLLGDAGVGKSSLIYTLVNDEFPTSIPKRMANIVIPPNVIDNVYIHISDYNEVEQTQDELRESIVDADVICIAYIAGDFDSLDRVREHWLPLIRKFQPSVSGTYKPIILAGNKADISKEEKSLDRVSSLIQDFVEIEAFIETSCLAQKNVVELFLTAQKAVTYPLAILFDPQLRVLTKKCKNALSNIFKICDLDGNGLLTDYELQQFQQYCFEIPLQEDTLDDLKNIVYQSTIDGIVDGAMTEAGFIFLHSLSIEKGRHDFTWQVLRKFNYDNQLNTTNPTEYIGKLDDDLSHRSSLSSSRSRYQSSSELSDDDKEDLSQMELSWVREHSDIIKAGLGLTLATLLSILAFKLLHNRNSL